MWDRQRIENYKLKKLKYLIKYSWDNIPFYRKYWKENAITPDDLVNLDDLNKFPLVTKEMVRLDGTSFLHPDLDLNSLKKYSTSGSTGVPLNVWSRR